MQNKPRFQQDLDKGEKYRALALSFILPIFVAMTGCTKGIGVEGGVQNSVEDLAESTKSCNEISDFDSSEKALKRCLKWSNKCQRSSGSEFADQKDCLQFFHQVCQLDMSAGDQQMEKCKNRLQTCQRVFPKLKSIKESFPSEEAKTKIPKIRKCVKNERKLEAKNAKKAGVCDFYQVTDKLRSVSTHDKLCLKSMNRCSRALNGNKLEKRQFSNCVFSQIAHARYSSEADNISSTLKELLFMNALFDSMTLNIRFLATDKEENILGNTMESFKLIMNHCMVGEVNKTGGHQLRRVKSCARLKLRDAYCYKANPDLKKAMEKENQKICHQFMQSCSKKALDYRAPLLFEDFARCMKDKRQEFIAKNLERSYDSKGGENELSSKDEVEGKGEQVGEILIQGKETRPFCWQKDGTVDKCQE